MAYQENLFTTRAETLDRESQIFKDNLNSKGEAVCPCCGRDALVSKHQVHSVLAYMLGRLYAVSMQKHTIPNGWCHIEEFRPDNHGSGRNFCIVKHWNLAEPMPAGYMEDKRSSGNWRLTEEGVAWVENRSTIDAHVFVFDNEVIKRSKDKISITQALKEKFSYFDCVGINNMEGNENDR